MGGRSSPDGPPDLLVNNAAAINRNAPLWRVPAEEFSRVVDVNVKGVTNVIRHFLLSWSNEIRPLNFGTIGGAQCHASQDKLVDRCTGNRGVASPRKTRRETEQGGAQKSGVRTRKGLARDPAQAARRIVTTGRCLRSCW